MVTLYLWPLRTWTGDHEALATDLHTISTPHHIVLVTLTTYVPCCGEDLVDSALDVVDGEETCDTRW
jgi:hypothetical protein